MVQWLIIRLPMQRIEPDPSVWEDPIRLVQLRCHSYGTPQPRDCAPQQEKPPHRNEKLPLATTGSSPHSLRVEKAHRRGGAQHSQNKQANKEMNFFLKKTALLLGSMMETQDVCCHTLHLTGDLVPSFWGFLIQSLYSFSQMGKKWLMGWMRTLLGATFIPILYIQEGNLHGLEYFPIEKNSKSGKI